MKNYPACKELIGVLHEKVTLHMKSENPDQMNLSSLVN